MNNPTDIPQVTYPAVTVTQALWLQPGGAAGFGTASAPDPSKNPPTLEIDGSLKMGATITAFSIDGTFSNPGDALVPVQSAVKTYVDGQIASLNQQLAGKAPLNGSASNNFSAQNLSVAADLTVAKSLVVGSNKEPAAVLDVEGSMRVSGPVQLFGAWGSTVTLSGSNPTYSVSAASTDGIVLVSLSAGASGSGVAAGATPTGTGHATASVGPSTGARSFSFPVRNGDSWQVSLSNVSGSCSAQIVWISLGADS